MSRAALPANSLTCFDLCVQHFALGKGACLTTQKGFARVLKRDDSICAWVCACVCTCVVVVLCVCACLCGLLSVVSVCVWLCVSACSCVGCCRLCACVWLCCVVARLRVDGSIILECSDDDPTVGVVASVRFETSI